MCPHFSALKKGAMLKETPCTILQATKVVGGDFLPFQHPDFVLQGVFLAPESFLVDDLDCVHLPILLRLR